MKEDASFHNHRLSRRRPPKGGVRVACHRGGLYLGPNLGLSVLDLSETGARLLLKEPLEPGREVSVKLEGRPNARPVRRVADVAWSVPMADGGHCVGVRFQKHLTFREFSELSREPPEAGAAGSPPIQGLFAGPTVPLSLARPVQEPPSPSPASGQAPRASLPDANRRRSERLPAERFHCCHVSAREESGLAFQATVLDVSCGGAGLLAPHRLAPGATVVLRFAAPGGREGRGILARSASAAELAAGGFLLGVEFLLPLTEGECRAIMSAAGDAAPGREADPTDAPG